ncbi:MAG: ABC-type transport system ATP-binding protein [Osedax symbiont Rs2]|nr:MAG: ABC-type transport system ATP-binding protein [Osedax symbiont Rs2]
MNKKSATPARADQPVVDIRGLRKSFAGIEVLKGIDLQAYAGEVIALIGGSGSGKSTTLRCINLLEAPSAGSISLFGTPLQLKPCSTGDLQIADRAQLRRIRAKLGMVFQNFNLWPHLSLEQNIMEAPMQVLRYSKGEARDAAHALLERVGLYEKRCSYPATLSGGQQQRAAIARSLAMEPEVMLFDEPTSALDPELVAEVLAVIQGLAEEGRTMIIVTHEMKFAAQVANKIMFLNEGRVEEEGTAQQIFGNPNSERLKQFVSSIK